MTSERCWAAGDVVSNILLLYADLMLLGVVGMPYWLFCRASDIILLYL